MFCLPLLRNRVNSILILFSRIGGNRIIFLTLLIRDYFIMFIFMGVQCDISNFFLCILFGVPGNIAQYHQSPYEMLVRYMTVVYDFDLLTDGLISVHTANTY